MKKLLFICLFLYSAIELFSQTGFNISGTVTKKIDIVGYSSIAQGQIVTLKGFNRDTYYQNPLIEGVSEGRQVFIYLKDIDKIKLAEPKTNDQVWEIIQLKSELYNNLYNQGFQYDLRRDLEAETIELLANLEKYYGFFQDEYLEDYLQSLLYKIHPVTLNDGRPGNLNIKILKTSDPNAFCTPNGTVIVTTGILSTIRSEDELMGILAHEVAHYVLDHQIVNINKSVARQKRAEFWAGFATAMAAMSEVYLAAEHDVYLGGNLTMATAILSTSIASSITDRLGAKYSQEQETEADMAATKILSFLKRDPKALAAALSRIQTYCWLNGDYLALSGAGTHPALQDRINAIGVVNPDQFISKDYDKLVSFVNTHNAKNEFSIKHLETTLNLTTRNIESGVPTEDDYLLKAMATRALYDNPEKNQEVLDLINKAKSLNVIPNNYINKQEGITLLRMGKKIEAVAAFQLYLKNLEADNEQSQFIRDEIEWTKKMIYKSKLL